MVSIKWHVLAGAPNLSGELMELCDPYMLPATVNTSCILFLLLAARGDHLPGYEEKEPRYTASSEHTRSSRACVYASSSNS